MIETINKLIRTSRQLVQELGRQARIVSAGLCEFKARVFADIKKKHSAHAITADVTVAETAHAAEFFLVDGVIVTGVATGQAADPEEVTSVRAGVGVPTFVGSGITPENMARFAAADGFIVGSWVKRDGHWAGPLDPARARAVAVAFEALP